MARSWTIAAVSLGVLASIGVYYHLESNTRQTIDAFTGFHVTGISLTQGTSRFRPQEVTQYELYKIGSELGGWWNADDADWKREWAQAFPGLVVETDRGRINFHGVWMVLLPDEGGQPYSRLMAPAEQESVERIKARIRWVPVH